MSITSTSTSQVGRGVGERGRARHAQPPTTKRLFQPVRGGEATENLTRKISKNPTENIKKSNSKTECIYIFFIRKEIKLPIITSVYPKVKTIYNEKTRSYRVQSALKIFYIYFPQKIISTVIIIVTKFITG